MCVHDIHKPYAIASQDPLAALLLLPSLSSFDGVQRLARCVMALEATSREVCRSAEGMGFWRHAAYAAGRVGGLRDHHVALLLGSSAVLEAFSLVKDMI